MRISPAMCVTTTKIPHSRNPRPSPNLYSVPCTQQICHLKKKTPRRKKRTTCARDTSKRITHEGTARPPAFTSFPIIIGLKPALALHASDARRTDTDVSSIRHRAGSSLGWGCGLRHRVHARGVHCWLALPLSLSQKQPASCSEIPPHVVVSGWLPARELLLLDSGLQQR